MYKTVNINSLLEIPIKDVNLDYVSILVPSFMDCCNPQLIQSSLWLNDKVTMDITSSGHTENNDIVLLTYRQLLGIDDGEPALKNKSQYRFVVTTGIDEVSTRIKNTLR